MTPNDRFERTACRARPSARICVIGIVVTAFTVSHALAQQGAVVQLKDDPYRRLVIENTIVRVWDVLVPLGEWTPFHEHKADTVSVRINSTEITNEPRGGLFSSSRDFRLESGTVSFSDYSKSPYVHRLTPKGPNPHHVIEVELLGPPDANHSSQGGERPGFTQLVDNPRIRASRLVLERGQSTDLIARGRNTLVVVISGGRAYEESTTHGGQSQELRAGEVQWQSEPTRHSFRNDGASSILLIEVEVK